MRTGPLCIIHYTLYIMQEIRRNVGNVLLEYFQTKMEDYIGKEIEVICSAVNKIIYM